jgi:hypothetical protein
MESSIMPYTTSSSDRLIALMLDESIPRNQSTCRDCSLYQPSNHYHGTCAHKAITLAHNPSCYQAQIQSPSTGQAAEPTGEYNSSATDIEEPDYTLATMTDETLDEIAAAMDLEELADLAHTIDEYLKLSDRADRETAPEDKAEVAAAQSQKLLSIQQQMINLAIDMGLTTITPELYQRLYGQQSR